MQKNILLTGGTGFVGSHLARALVKEKFSVHVLSRNASEYSREVLHGLAVTIHEYDGNMDKLTEILVKARPVVVIHLASLFIAEHKSNDIGELIDSNLKYATQVLDAAVNAGVKNYINTGTVWEHYNNSAEYNPACLYAATKHAFQKVIDFYVDASALKAVTLLLPDTYGEDDSRGKLVSYIRDRIKSRDKMHFSPGEQMIDLLHIDDVVSAYSICIGKLCANEITGHKRYALTSGKPLVLKELVAQLEKIVGRSFEVDWHARDYRSREMMFAYDKGETLPGWQPQISLREGLSRILG